MKVRIEDLEVTILELGSEVFKLKHALTSLSLQNQNFMHIIASLKTMLSDKGVISEEDFDEAIDLGAVSEVLQKFSDPESELSHRSMVKKAH